MTESDWTYAYKEAMKRYDADSVHDGYLRLREHLDRHPDMATGRDDLARLLCTAARRCRIDAIRRDSRTVFLPDLPDMAEQPRDTTLDDVTDCLSEQEQATLTAYLSEGSQRAAAALLGISQQAMSSRLKRITKKIKDG